MSRFIAIWFYHLKTDWYTLAEPALKQVPFVLSEMNRGRKLITAVNPVALDKELFPGMTVADAKALVPGLHVKDDPPDLAHTLLNTLGEWCIRYSPAIALDPPDGLLLEATGCTHLWGSDGVYLSTIKHSLRKRGYHVRAAIADTVGAAWAVARFTKGDGYVREGEQAAVLKPLPPKALRLEEVLLDKLDKLGFREIDSFMRIPRNVLRRRFGPELSRRLDQALGYASELLEPIQPPEPYEERLPCMEPIVAAAGIRIAIERLLAALCRRLEAEGNGVRTATLHTFRVDGKRQQISIGTNRATYHVAHLQKLFEEKVCMIEPDLGIEMFLLVADKTGPVKVPQVKLWAQDAGLQHAALAELLDRIGNKFGEEVVHRYLPVERHWPERSIQPASLEAVPQTAWNHRVRRPIMLLKQPEEITVMSPLPDYPPINFRYKNQLHTVRKASVPGRKEREWWMDAGQPRDYYMVEDENGRRYWLFRLGHYDDVVPCKWYIHGFFA
ncbi:nucleotidyltransferase [Chitinophaga parva]|uniref:Nucleotidyltransferase n=1 Tax=Chitinophaga parva TaxID=2169414 RepID=A0A2T7BE50_9BACT|nr:DNA polymerase Y family protein [Chitinophaga parva]PUZ23357.1 nucleotidyltransferase [Chitinophaga parva]